jgi:hypothetical protein
MKRWVGMLLAGLVLAVALLGAGRPSWAAHPEPKVIVPKWEYAPGPGWPAGWTPPAAPTEIPPEIIEGWEFEKKIGADTADRLEMRVLNFLPPWTEEYPYIWTVDTFRCGETEYVYWHPMPDRYLLHELYGDGLIMAQGTMGGPDCVFTPINKIETARISEEALRRRDLEFRLNDEMSYSRLGVPSKGGLLGCGAQDHDGSFENIYVCFNDGDASARFDVPAYLDISVGRVRVPVRFVSELMGAEVTWDNPTQTVTLRFPAISRPTVRPVPKEGLTPADWTDPNDYTFDGGSYDIVETTYTQAARTITLTVGKKVAIVDGQEVPIDAPPVLLPPGRVMVPVRFVSEVMGAKVYWVGQEPIFRAFNNTLRGTYQVHIYTKAYPFYEYPSWFLETRAQKT